MSSTSVAATYNINTSIPINYIMKISSFFFIHQKQTKSHWIWKFYLKQGYTHHIKDSELKVVDQYSLDRIRTDEIYIISGRLGSSGSWIPSLISGNLRFVHQSVEHTHWEFELWQGNVNGFLFLLWIENPDRQQTNEIFRRLLA